MYHLSKEMTALVLPFETFGSHLNSGGETIDEALEKENFKAAGGILSEIWSNLVIDEHTVKAEYIEMPTSDQTKNYTVTPLFRSRHIHVCTFTFDDSLDMYLKKFRKTFPK